MAKSFWRWTGWFLFLLALDFTVPFAFLKHAPTVGGSFLFWTVWIVLAIGSMFVLFLRWQDSDS